MNDVKLLHFSRFSGNEFVNEVTAAPHDFDAVLKVFQKRGNIDFIELLGRDKFLIVSK